MWGVAKISVKAKKLTKVTVVVSHLVSTKNFLPLKKFLIPFGILQIY